MNQKIVITNDHSEKLSELLKVLRKNGYDVFLSPSNGKALLKAVEKEQPDILITDAFMENFDIFGFLSAIGKRLSERGTKIFVKSALKSRCFEKKVLLSGADAYLLKPVDYRFITGEKKRNDEEEKIGPFLFRRAVAHR